MKERLADRKTGELGGKKGPASGTDGASHDSAEAMVGGGEGWIGR